MSGYKIDKLPDGNLKIIGEKSKPFSPAIRDAVFELLDVKGKNYNNDVMFKLVKEESGFKSKRFGKINGENTFLDQFTTGAFDIGDYEKLLNPIIQAVNLGHVIAERAHVENYKAQLEKYEAEGDPSTPVYEWDEEKKAVKGTMKIDPVYESAHLAGKVLETKVLEDLFQVNGKPAKLDIPTKEPTNADNPKKWDYRGIIISIMADPDNKNKVISADIDIPDKSIQPKKSSEK